MASSINGSNIKQGLKKLTVQEAHNAKLGQAGMVLIDDTDEHVGPFCAIFCLTNAAVDISECEIGIDDAADFTIEKGWTIYGHFPSIELDSGSIIAYNGPEK